MNDQILKDITSGIEAKEKLKAGIDQLADIVSSTMGYRGRTVLIESVYGMPEPTKDGYKTLQNINLDDAVENMACKVAKEASQRTVDLAGDATTSTIVLLQALFAESLKALKAGKSAIDIKHEIENSRDKIVAYLDEISQKLTDEDIYNVALTSANGEEELAKIVSDAFIKAGENGAVSHLRSNDHETHLDFIDGTLLEGGYASDLLINNFADRTTEFSDNPLIVCSNIVFKSFDVQVLPFIKFAMQNQRQLVIVADWTDSASYGIRDVIIRNVIEKQLPIVLVNSPSFGNKRRDFMSDLAMLCGTQFLSSLSGDMFVGREAQFLGTCKSIIVGKTDTIIVPLENEEIDIAANSKIDELKEQLKVAKTELEKKYIKDRISKISGGISIIKVGAIIESELQERIDRIEDAVCAVRSAREEGVVAGGGVALYNAARLDLDPVCNIAVVAPLNRILSNADVKDFINSAEYPIGYDVKNFKQVDMIASGILDSTKAIKHALINACSASNTLLMTNHCLTNRTKNTHSHGN